MLLEGGHTIALKNNGELWAWGANFNGQLGDGSTTSSIVPVLVEEESAWKDIDTGFEFSLALKSDGTIWSWGFNANGQLGLGNNVQRLIPTQIGEEDNYKFIATGSAFGFAINDQNELFGWGANILGELGLGHSMQQLSPIQIGTDNNWTMVAGAEGTVVNNSLLGLHTAGLRDDQMAVCVSGANYVGQLGKEDLVNISSFDCSIANGLVDVKDSFSNFEKVKISPNPTSNFITISHGSEKVNLSISDMIGNVLLNKISADSSETLDISQLRSGIYWLRLQYGHEFMSKKILKVD